MAKKWGRLRGKHQDIGRIRSWSSLHKSLAIVVRCWGGSSELLKVVVVASVGAMTALVDLLCRFIVPEPDMYLFAIKSIRPLMRFTIKRLASAAILVR